MTNGGRRKRSVLGFSLLALTGSWGPSQVAALGRAYTANFGSNNLSVIDTSSNTVVATVPLGDSTEFSSAHAGWKPRVCNERRGRRLGALDSHQRCARQDSGGRLPEWNRHHARWDTGLRDQRQR